MKSNIKLLIVQMGSIIADKNANFQKAFSLLSNHSIKDVDFIIFPELWSTGWDCEKFPYSSENENNSTTVDFLKTLAIKYNANILGGSYIEKRQDGKLYNTSPILNRNGELIAKYDKMHLYSYLGDTENLYITAGKHPIVVETDVCKIGVTICYDIRFPEIFRTCTYSGADILVNMAAWPKSRKNHWITLQKARAIENQSFMVAVSQTGLLKDDIYNIGNSMVIDPLGNIISSLDEEEKLLEVSINLNEMYNLRKNVKTLNDRHNEYKLLEVK